MKIAVLGLMDTSHLAPHAPEGVELVIYPPRIGAFPHTPYDRLLVDLAHVDAAERAAADGVDAILIDSTCDWGIEAIRAAVDVPVVGAGEVGITEASAGGRRFGIVTIWPPALEFLYTERARMVPGGELCTGIRYASGDHELARLGEDESVIARMDRRDESGSGKTPRRVPPVGRGGRRRGDPARVHLHGEDGAADRGALPGRAR